MNGLRPGRRAEGKGGWQGRRGEVLSSKTQTMLAARAFGVGGCLCSAPAFMAFLGNEVLRVRGPRQRKCTRSETVQATIPRCRGLLSVCLLAQSPPSGSLLLPVERLCSVVVLGGTWHRWPKFRSGEPVLLRDREVSMTSSLCTLRCGMQDVGRRT